ncbi:MAG: hypothetical protein ABFS28_00500 [Bacteroidota bacterium]
MKTQKLNEARVIMIIEAFTDFIEHTYDEQGETADVSKLVNTVFDEFVYWAFDDLIINEVERDTLLNSKEWAFHESIKREVAGRFIIA